MEDKAPRFHAHHLARVVDVGLGAQRHPPRALDDRDVAVLVVEMRTAAPSRREGVLDDVYPRFARIARDDDLRGPFGGPYLLRLQRNELGAGRSRLSVRDGAQRICAEAADQPPDASRGCARRHRAPWLARILALDRFQGCPGREEENALPSSPSRRSSVSLHPGWEAP